MSEHEFIYDISELIYKFMEQDKPLNNYVKEIYEQEIEQIAEDEFYLPSPAFGQLLKQVLISEILSQGVQALEGLDLLRKL